MLLGFAHIMALGITSSLNKEGHDCPQHRMYELLLCNFSHA